MSTAVDCKGCGVGHSIPKGRVLVCGCGQVVTAPVPIQTKECKWDKPQVHKGGSRSVDRMHGSKDVER